MEILFTIPVQDATSTYQGGPDEALVFAIQSAEKTIELAVMHLNLWSVRDALLDAVQRGVVVRVVTESDYILEPEITDLELAGIPVLGDRRESLMHHKFMVIDSRDVWTGSMNYTVNGAYRNDNNIIHIQSETLAENYQQEFYEMFDHDRFGDFSYPDTHFPEVEVAGTRIEVYFSPDEDAERRLVELIADSEERIDFLAYVLTSDPISEELLASAGRGIEVRGVVEASQADQTGSDYVRMLESGLEVRRDSNPKSMHHKVILIDDSIVVTGSYNFSRSAKERNDENLIIVHSPELASEFRGEFERIFNDATP